MPDAESPSNGAAATDAAGSPPSGSDAASIGNLPLELRAPAYAAVLERLRGELEADGRG